MRKNPGPAATEILERIQRLKVFTTQDVEAFPKGSDKRDALERCLEVVSEASRHLPPEAMTAHPEVDWQALADLGNVLRHGYDIVSIEDLLTIMRSHLDPLETAVRAILDGLDTR